MDQLPYTDLQLSAWRDYDHIETDSLWLFSSRDRQNGHQLEYHGNCVPQIVTQVLTRYTRPDDIVLDLFEGSGTSAIEASRLGRRLIGVDIQPAMVAHVQNRLDELGVGPHQVQLFAEDSTQQQACTDAVMQRLSQWQARQAQFLFLHPPYADIIRFSKDPRDLSNAESIEAFLDGFERVAQTGFQLLQPGRFAALVIGDCYQHGEWVPLGFYCLQRMMKAGFLNKSIVVKNMTGNEKAKGRQSNLWRYRALKGGFYVFKHEYVMILQKPARPRTVRRAETRIKPLVKTY